MRISDWSSDVCSSDLVDVDAPFTFLTTLLDRDNFLGRILTGRVQTGTLNMNQPIHALDRDGKIVETGRATKIMAFRGLDRVPVESAKAGDIISPPGLTDRNHAVQGKSVSISVDLG